MRVVVDYTLCESNAVCVRLVPEVFEVHDDDRLYPAGGAPPEALREPRGPRRAALPKQALSLIDD